MTAKHKAPKIHPSEFKRTKILATVGPGTNSYKAVFDMIAAGANGIRLNFSHITYEDCEQQVKWIRKASKELDKPVAIVQDLQGPKIRLGNFDGVIPVQKGQHLQLKYKADHTRSGMIPTQFDLSKRVKRGERIFIFDGKVKTTVTSVKDGIVHVHVENDGVLIERKGLNLPDTDLSGDIITEKDLKDLAFGSTQDVDYIAQSFIQTAHDVKAMRKHLKNVGSDAKIIAKIETNAAVENIDDIVSEADAVMIARGDLAVETSNEMVPIMQRKIVGLCRKHAKTVIVATQMLASMVDADEPSRAEVSDVATAAIIGADCVMLSEETAVGKHPVKAVATMKRIVKFSEKNMPTVVLFALDMTPDTSTRQTAICNAVVNLAKEVEATAIVAETKTGATAVQIAARRPEKPVIAVTSSSRVGNQLALEYGVKSFVRPDHKYAATKVTDWLEKSGVLKKGDCIVTASGLHPGVVGSTDTIKVRVL